jgi:hypothetical protein
MGVGLVIEFIEYLQMVTTRIYTSIANLPNLQFNTARTKYS